MLMSFADSAFLILYMPIRSFVVQDTCTVRVGEYLVPQFAATSATADSGKASVSAFRQVFGIRLISY